MMRRKATQSEINTAFAQRRIQLGRCLSGAEVQQLDANLAEERERDGATDYDQLVGLSARLRQCGEKRVGTPASEEDLQLYSFCAGMLAGLASRVRALEEALTQEARLI